jgi:hypothetical protein
MECVTYWLFQDAMVWGNKSCWMLSLLLPEVRGSAGQTPRIVKPPNPDVNYPHILPGRGMIDKCGKLDRIQ